jgi:hypothetical protein
MPRSGVSSRFDITPLAKLFLSIRKLRFLNHLLRQQVSLRPDRFKTLRLKKISFENLTGYSFHGSLSLEATT